MIRSQLILLMCTIIHCALHAQELVLRDLPVRTSIRGMSVVNDSTLWISGSNGYVGYSSDAGNQWIFTQIAGYEQAELRDIHVFDNGTVMVMSSTKPAAILRSVDTGKTWSAVFQKDDEAYFLDAFDFYGKNGICLGDPIHGAFLILRTADAGSTWTEQFTTQRADSLAAFAASGSVIRYLSKKQIVFATGGREANIYYSKNGGQSWQSYRTNMHCGDPSSGIFSIDVIDRETIVLAGGDYSKPELNSGNFMVMSNVSGQWEPAWLNPIIHITNGGSGYYSCVVALPETDGTLYYACGTGGLDRMHTARDPYWITLSETGFNVLQAAPGQRIIFLAGTNVFGMMQITSDRK